MAAMFAWRVNRAVAAAASKICANTNIKLLTIEPSSVFRIHRLKKSFLPAAVMSI
jgi:hypothetical protein